MKLNPKHCVLFFLIALSLFKDSHALNTQLFHPLIGQPNQGLTVYGSKGLQEGHFQIGVFTNYTDDPLEFSLPPDDRVDAIVNTFVTTDVLMSYGFTDWFTLHAGAPFNPYSNVEPLADFAPTKDASMGDLRFAATLNLYRKMDSVDPTIQRGGVALVPFVTVPMKNRDDFFGESSWTGGGVLVFDRHLSKRHYISFNLGARFRERERILNLVVAHEALASGSYVYRFSCKHKIDFLIEGQTSTTFRKFVMEEISSPAEVLFGLRKQSQSQHWEFNGGVSRGINNGYGAADFHAYGGISYLFFNKTKPRGHCCDAFAKKPEPIQQEQPKIVTQLGTLHIEVVDSNGQARVVPIRLLRDQKTVIENQTNRIRQSIEPGEYMIVVDHSPRIEKKIVVLESQETHEKIVLVAPAPIALETRYIEPIYFDSNKDTIKVESFKALDDVYSVILEFPNIKSLKIEAHTDSQGSDSHNLDLSNRRAQSAKQYLVRKGVSSSVIQTQGFGEVRPIAPNDTADGRAKNRRVEFIIEAPNANIKIIQKQ